MNKNNKLFLIDGIDKELMRLRRAGYSYQKMTDYINNNYEKQLNGNKILLTNIWFFFKRHLKEEIKKVEEKRIETISRAITNSDKLEDLLKTLYEWMDQYKAEGQRLNLRDTINSITRIHELLVKMKEEAEGKQSNEALQSFLTKVQGEFASPSITKEVEYDGEGNITKAKVTQNLPCYKNKKDNSEEIVEEKGEEVSEEAKSSSSCSNSQTANQ